MVNVVLVLSWAGRDEAERILRKTCEACGNGYIGKPGGIVPVLCVSL